MDFMKTCIYLYDKKREEVLESRRQFKRINPRNTPFPIDLQGEWGKECTLERVTEQIQNQIEDASINSNITEDEINMSRGCERKVHMEFYIMLFPYSFDTINHFNIGHYICFNQNKWFFRGEEISSNVGIWLTLSSRMCL